MKKILLSLALSLLTLANIAQAIDKNEVDFYDLNGEDLYARFKETGHSESIINGYQGTTCIEKQIKYSTDITCKGLIIKADRKASSKVTNDLHEFLNQSQAPYTGMSYWIKNDFKNINAVNFAVYYDFGFYYNFLTHPQDTYFFNCGKIALAQTGTNEGNIWGFFALNSSSPEAHVMQCIMTKLGDSSFAMDVSVLINNKDNSNNKFKIIPMIMMN